MVQYTTSSLAPGTHSITAAYSGDQNYAPSTSAPQMVTITSGAATTTTTLTITPAAAVYRQPVTLTASTLTALGGPVTAGQVIFCSVSAKTCTPELSLASAQVNSAGTASVKLPAGLIGTHGYIAAFLGVTGFQSSTSASQNVMVTGTYPTSTTVTSTGAAGDYTLTGTVAGFGLRSAGPTGTVTFNDTSNANSPLLGTATLGAAAPGFTAVQPAGSPFAAGGEPYGVATGDFNGDGFLDVVTENYGAGTVSVLLGNGDGTFQAPVTYGVGALPERVLVADFNADGKSDLVVANTASGTVSILLGNGDGTFQPQVTYATGGSPVGLGVLDLNHDGFADIVAGDYYDNTISVLLGNGDGTFKAYVTYPTGGTPQTLAEGDFNGDGNVDVVVGNETGGTVGVFLGNGDGTFQAQVTYPVGKAPQGVQVGDFNGDGIDDLAVSNSSDNTISVLLGKGDGTFQPQVTYPVGAGPVGIVIADFNGDGIQDLSVGNTSQSALTQSILLGNGDGTFQPQLTFPTGNFPYGEAVGDFDNDGYPDLAISDFSDGTETILLSRVTQTATASISNVSLGGTPGTHNVSASYPGDPNFSQSTSPAIPLISAALAPSSVNLTIMPAAPTVGQTIVFSATVAGTMQTSPPPTGTVTLTDGPVTQPTMLGTINLGTTGSGTFSTSGLPAGTYSIVATYSGDSVYAPSAGQPMQLVVSRVSQTITFPPIPNQTVGAAPFALAATASSGLPVSYTVTAGPATVSGNMVTVSGAGMVTIQASQPGNSTYAPATPVSQSFTVSASVPTLTGIAPAAGMLGSPATTVTLTGTNFNTGDLVLLNGSQIPSMFGSATMLSATIPASFFATAGTGLITVFDPASGTTTAAQDFVVLPAPQIVFSGPSTAGSDQQPMLTLTLVNPYPYPLAGALTLTFAPLASTGLADDPMVAFASGGRTLTFTIPANSTLTPAVLLQTGTIAGAATVTAAVTAQGVNVTPASVAPVVITVAAAVPTADSATITRTGQNLDVAVVGFSNTREMVNATFHFTPTAGNTIANPDVTVPVTADFAAWYGTAASDAYGSMFTYTQSFSLDVDAAVVQSVTVTLTNTVGASAVLTAQ
jgi:hypothetical protein